MEIAGFRIGDRWWNRSAMAGLLGGLTMMLYQMTASAVAGQGFWRPLNLIGGAIPYFRPPAPGLALPPVDAFWPGTTVGLALHLVNAMAWGLGYGLLVAVLGAYFAPGLSRSWSFAALVGLGWGLTTWLVMGLLIGPALNPAMNWVDPAWYFMGHLVFGEVTALTFTSLTRRPRVTVTFAPRGARVARDRVSTGSRE